MTQTAAHLADHVIPPVPVRQWVISVPKRLWGMLADRPRAVAALTRIFFDEVERLLLTASGGAPDAETPGALRPRLGGISFLHRFGSALNHHVHLHASERFITKVKPSRSATRHSLRGGRVAVGQERLEGRARAFPRFPESVA